MGQLRQLKLNSIDAIVADIEQLRRGHAPGGNWTLAQTCWHLALAPQHCLIAPASNEPTAAEQKMQAFLDAMIADGVMPAGLPIAPGTEPSADADDTSIDACIAAHLAVKAYDKSHVTFGPFGPVQTSKFVAFLCLHASTHLGFYEPRKAVRRADLSFADEAAIVAELRQLRRGHVRAGNWSLNQIAWHLDATTKARMNPIAGVPYTDEQKARRAQFDQVLSTGRLPDALPMPDTFAPPASFDVDPIEALVKTLTDFAAYQGAYGHHRLFGPLTQDEARRINRIHCAHHLSHLVPLSPSK